MAINRKRTRLDDFLVLHSDGQETLICIDDIVQLRVAQKQSYSSYSSRGRKKTIPTAVILSNGNTAIVSENIEYIKKLLEKSVI
jgi:hypothetical protein